MDEQSKIIINGNAFPFEKGESIFQVAKRNHIDIPTLSYLERASEHTAECGISVVEVQGKKELVPSTITPASENMVVFTDSPKVIEARRKAIRDLMASGNHNCAVLGSDNRDWTQFQLAVHQEDASPELCPVWGDCRLQDLAYRYHVSGERYPKADIAYPMETVNPFIVRDFSRCIRCGRCVQACNEVQVNNAIDFGYEGALTKVVTPDDKPLRDSDCVFCGECVQACPVGALVEKDAKYQVRPWETEKVRTTCSYCGVGCQLHLHVKDGKVVKVTGVEGVPPNYGSLCVKGRFGFNFVNSPDRLTTPLIRENGEFREASWDEALNLVAQKLGSIRDEHGADSMGVLTSARVSNEENYVANKFARAVLKTNNIDHCARL